MENSIQHSIDVQDLKQIYIIASMPRTVFNRFRGHQTVRHAAYSFNTTTLTMGVRSITRKAWPLTLDEITYMYAALVALSFKPIDEIKDFLYDELDNHVEWVRQIKKFIIDLKQEEEQVATN